MKIKKTVKKLSLFLVLAVLAVVTTLSINRDVQAKTDKPIEITYWNLLGGGDGIILKDIIEKYNKENPDVRIVNMTQDWGQYYTKLGAAILGGMAPDLAMTHVTRLYELKVKNAIIPISDEAKRFGIAFNYKNFSSKLLDHLIMGGKYYAIPFDNLVMVLYYNKQILSDAGLLDKEGKPIIGKNFSGFINALQTIKKKRPDVVPLVMQQKGFTLQLIWYSLYLQMNGGKLLSKDLKTAAFNKTLAVKAAEAMKELYSYTPPKLEDASIMFNLGHTAFYFEGSWQCNSMRDKLGDKLGVISFPQLFAKPYIWTDSQSFILPANPKRSDEHTAAALKFVKWFSDNNWMWARAGHIPANNTAWNTPEFKSIPLVPNYSNSGKYGVPFQSTANVWLTFCPELTEPFENMVINNASPKDTITTIENNLNQSLSQ